MGVDVAKREKIGRKQLLKLCFPDRRAEQKMAGTKVAKIESQGKEQLEMQTM